jgi:hypothetical protein
MNPNILLRRVLAFDALTCAAMGVLLLAASTPLAGLLALPRPLLIEAGILLLPFAAFVLWAAGRGERIEAPARIVAWLNLGWVAASAGLFAFVSPNLFGTVFVAAQALAVAGIAALQLHGLAGFRRAYA